MSKLTFFMMEAEITSENSEEIFKTIANAIAGKPVTAPRPQAAPVLKPPQSRTAVSQHIETPAKPEAESFSCAKCGATDFSNNQARSRHQNRCDGTDKHKQSRLNQRNWKANKQKSNGHQNPETFPCPVNDCAFQPFRSQAAVETHVRRLHPEH